MGSAMARSSLSVTSPFVWATIIMSAMLSSLLSTWAIAAVFAMTSASRELRLESNESILALTSSKPGLMNPNTATTRPRTIRIVYSKPWVF